MDVSLPDGDGIAVSRRIFEFLPDVRIVMISGLSDEKTVNEAIRAGVAGYLLKSNASSELISCLRAVAAGNAFLSPEIAILVMRGFKQLLDNPGGSASTLLSEREREVLRLLAAGLRTKEIALRMGIGVKTIETYRARLLKKLGCASTNELVRYAIREGISPV
jgi:DNA-binding NarL/FixJ family response regulator